jgi:hypothetical protein
VIQKFKNLLCGSFQVSEPIPNEQTLRVFKPCLLDIIFFGLDRLPAEYLISEFYSCFLLLTSTFSIFLHKFGNCDNGNILKGSERSTAASAQSMLSSHFLQ